MKTSIIKPDESNIKLCATLVRRGEIVAFPTETVYGVGADGLNESAVPKIFAAKGRPQTNPVTLHVSSLSQIEKVAFVTEEARKLIDAFFPGPLTIVLKKKDAVPSVTVAGGDTVAVRMPASEIALRLIEECGVPLAATSANKSGGPSPVTAEHVLADLNGKLRYILDGGQCDYGLESTVLNLSGNDPVILRKGRIGARELSRVIGRPVKDSSLPDLSKIPVGYKPKAVLRFVEYSVRQAEIMERAAGELRMQGKKVAVLSAESPGEYARSIFSLIRDAESGGADVIIAPGLKEDDAESEALNSLLKKLSLRNE